MAKKHEYTKKVKETIVLRSAVISAALFAVAVVSFGIITFFGIRKHDNILEIMKEDAASEVTFFNEVIEQEAAKMADYVAVNDKGAFYDNSLALDYIHSVSIDSEYISEYGLIDAKGICTLGGGMSIDLSAEDIFTEMHEKKTVLRGSVSGERKKIIEPMLFVPVFDGDEMIGGIIGILSNSILPNAYETGVGYETSMTLVTDKNLNGLVRNSKNGFLDKVSDFAAIIKSFHYFGGGKAEDLLEDIRSDSREITRIRFRAEEKYIYSIYDEKYDTYFIKFMPYTFVYAGARSFAKLYVLEIVVLLISLAGAIFTCLYIFKTYNKFSQTVECFDKLDNEYDTMTVDYNFDNSKLIVSGAADKIFGIERKRYEWVRAAELFELLHPEDSGVRKSLNDAVNKGETKYTCEFRVKREEDKYDWCKLIAIINRDDDNHANKLFGVIRKTEAEMEIARTFKRQSEEDLLTGLLNKITIEKETDEALLQKPDGIFVFFISDLDNFKSINDNFGHAKGDDVIRDTAQKLVKVFSINDFVGRIGGDEFAVVMTVPENMRDRVNALIDMKVKAISKSLARTYIGDKIAVDVTASIGIYIHNGTTETFADMYKKADKALYFSKENGKNRATIYSDELG